MVYCRNHRVVRQSKVHLPVISNVEGNPSWVRGQAWVESGNHWAEVHGRQAVIGVERRARVKSRWVIGTLRERVLGQTETGRDGQRHDDYKADCGNRELWNKRLKDGGKQPVQSSKQDWVR